MFKCEICGREFEKLISLAYHLSCHNVKGRDYFDKYLKRKNEGKCKICGNKTKFVSIIKGYYIYCFDCKSRTKNSFSPLEYRKPSHKKGKTYKQLYGVEKASELKKTFSEYGKKQIGDKNPFYKKDHTNDLKEIFRKKRLGKTYEEIYGFEKAQLVKNKIKKDKCKNSSHRDYWSAYPLKFYDGHMRKKILIQQKFICPLCFNKLQKRFYKNLHHINYVKKDNRRRNLVYLCVYCHGTTNANRSFWKVFLREVNREIIMKARLFKTNEKIIITSKKGNYRKIDKERSLTI